MKKMLDFYCWLASKASSSLGKFLFFMALICSTSCKTISNRFTEIRYICGSDAFSTIQYIKLLSPAGEEIKSSDLKLTNLDGDVAYENRTKNGCFPIISGKSYVASLKTPQLHWGKVISFAKGNESIRLENLDKWNISYKCSDSPNIKSEIALPVKWDRNISDSIGLSVFSSGVSIATNFKADKLNVDFLVGEGPFTLEFKWRDPFDLEYAGSIKCNYFMDRTAPQVESSITEVDSFRVEGGSFFYLKAEDKSNWEIRYCISSKDFPCSFLSSSSNVRLVAPPEGEWCLEYFGIDNLGNISEKKKACGISVDQKKIETIRTSLAFSDVSDEVFPFNSVIHSLKAWKIYKSLKTDFERDLVKHSLYEKLFNNAAQKLVYGQIRSRGMSEVLNAGPNFYIRRNEKSIDIFNKNLKFIHSFEWDVPKGCYGVSSKIFDDRIVVFDNCGMAIIHLKPNGQLSDTHLNINFYDNLILAFDVSGKFLFQKHDEAVSLLKWNGKEYDLVNHRKVEKNFFTGSPSEQLVDEDGEYAVFLTNEVLYLLKFQGDSVEIEESPMNYAYSSRIMGSGKDKIILVYKKKESDPFGSTFYFSTLDKKLSWNEVKISGFFSEAKFSGSRISKMQKIDSKKMFVILNDTLRVMEYSGGEFSLLSDSNQKIEVDEWLSSDDGQLTVIRSGQWLSYFEVPMGSNIPRRSMSPMPISKLLSDNLLVNFSMNKDGLTYGLDGVLTQWKKDPIAVNFVSRDEVANSIVLDEAIDLNECKFDMGWSKRSIGNNLVLVSDDSQNLMLFRFNSKCELTKIWQQHFSAEIQDFTLGPNGDVFFVFTSDGQLTKYNHINGNVKLKKSTVSPMSEYGSYSRYFPNQNKIAVFSKKAIQIYDEELQPLFKLKSKVPGYNFNGMILEKNNNYFIFPVDSFYTPSESWGLAGEYLKVTTDPLVLGNRICEGIGTFLQEGFVPGHWEGFEEADKYLCD